MIIEDLSQKYEDYIIELRRYFHTYPELSWQEKNTSLKIKEELDKLKIPYISVIGTGIIATIEGNKNGPVIGLRADMDALDILEENDVEYASKNTGVMHACGHDGHVAMLLGAGRILNELKEYLNGTVKLIFQPAEEIIEGAKKIIKMDELKDLSAIYAIHLWAGLESGKISLESGPRMASADKFILKVHGKGGHGASPHQGIDAIVAASSIVLSLQTVASREVDPLEPVVISIGKLTAGDKYNVIAKEALIEGTTRCFNKDIRERLPKIIERIALNTAKTYRADVELDYQYGTPPTINDTTCSKIAYDSAANLFGENSILQMTKVTGGEDFAMYLEKIPGAFIFLGVRNEAKEIVYPHHHEKFNIDESVLKKGAALMTQIALDHLTRN
ncbi:amidohydrolase [Clostridium bovifaecis]|uniref:Amidohydrolase n=1 Tax=Clostridium bovifaecis TaxID=2184719 RepID=A0A6I6FG40_9CLOT|nr:amidohydrolase [Clostridium bovifaecis]